MTRVRTSSSCSQKAPTDFIVFSQSRPVSSFFSGSLLFVFLPARSAPRSAAPSCPAADAICVFARPRAIRVWVINYAGVNWLLRGDHRKQPIALYPLALLPFCSVWSHLLAPLLPQLPLVRPVLRSSSRAS